MNARVRVVLLVAAGGVVLVSCRGGTSTVVRPTTIGPLTAQEYFDRVQTLEGTAQRRTANVSAQVPTGVAEAQALKALQDVVPEQLAVVEDLRDSLAQLEAPAPVRQAHEQALQAFDAFITFSKTASERVAEASTLADARAVITSAEAKAADAQLRAGCELLQGAAAAQGVDVDLKCGE